jgi:hypothetical protein
LARGPHGSGFRRGLLVRSAVGAVMIALLHPVAGLLFFSDFEEAQAAADDIGDAYDRNSIGTIKSRVCMCYALDRDGNIV